MAELEAAAPAVSSESSEVDSNGGQQDQVEQGSAPAPAPAAPTKAQVKKLKELQLKIDGKVEKVSLPFEIDDSPEQVEWMTRNLQLSKAAQKRMQEHSQLQSQVDEFITELRKNPRKVLSDPELGVDLRAIAQQLIEEDLSNSQKSPQELRQEELQRELEDLKNERENEKKARDEERKQQLQEQEIMKYDQTISKALEGSTLPKSPYVVKKMAEYMLMAVENNIDADANSIAALVEKEIQDEIKEMIAVMPAEILEKMIGKEFYNKVRQKNLAKGKVAPKIGVKAPDVGKMKNDAAPKEVKKQTFKDFFGV